MKPDSFILRALPQDPVVCGFQMTSKSVFQRYHQSVVANQVSLSDSWVFFSLSTFVCWSVCQLSAWAPLPPVQPASGQGAPALGPVGPVGLEPLPRRLRAGRVPGADNPSAPLPGEGRCRRRAVPPTPGPMGETALSHSFVRRGEVQVTIMTFFFFYSWWRLLLKHPSRGF